MSSLSELWNDYWWILPVLLMLLCILGCSRGCRMRGGCCSPWCGSPSDGEEGTCG
jgi:hypothetical protein